MKDLPIRAVTSICSGALFFLSYFCASWAFCLVLCCMLGVILFYELPPLLALRLSQPRFWFYAVLYPITPVMLLILLVVQYRSMCWLLPLYPYFAAWAVDMGGYFVGNLIGHHKCFPVISPKKTWEGLVGSVLVLLAFHYILNLEVIYLFSFCSYRPIV